MNIEDTICKIKEECCYTGIDCEHCRFNKDENGDWDFCDDNVLKVYSFKPDELFKFCLDCGVNIKELLSKVE